MIIKSIKYNGKSLNGVRIDVGTLDDSFVIIHDLDNNLLDGNYGNEISVNNKRYTLKSLAEMLDKKKGKIENMCITHSYAGTMFFIMIPRYIDMQFKEIIKVSKCPIERHILDRYFTYGINRYFVVSAVMGRFKVIPLVRYMLETSQELLVDDITETYYGVESGKEYYNVIVKIKDLNEYRILIAKEHFL